MFFFLDLGRQMKLPNVIHSLYFRIGMALTIVWMSISSYAYFSYLGFQLRMVSSNADLMPPLLSGWYNFSSKNLGFDVPFVFTYENVSTSDTYMYYHVYFRLEGFLEFVLVPTICVWALIILAYWVVEGGKKPS